MNRKILTYDRVCMAVVGPSGSGKTDLILKMVQGKSFYPKYLKVFYFYREFQPSFKNTAKNIDFIRFTNFDVTKSLENCLLIFDDSCEEIFNDREFLKLVTSGRHRGLHVIYVKHNLFQQSRFSRTLDLNTTHIILFKSPRDISQIEFLGKQLNNSVFLKSAYEKATAEPFGHLLIDLDPKTTEGLRYCSNVVGLSPSIFYLPPSRALPTKIVNEGEKRAYTATNSSI